ncbi:signal peptidase I [Microbulbifer litoralis]|uniref:signal peptidase I n=1 Tax=Microbulbifer litoralis TaxID=2933965 RepID=UPI0020283094|nr:signal peptidase I [Microbulbifer sp. GX H0434]
MKIWNFLAALGMLVLSVYLWNPSGTDTYDPRARILGFMFFHMPSDSMYPSVERNSYVYVTTFSYLFSEVDSGEMLVYRAPHTGSPFLGRVMGVSGDRVSLKNSSVILNGVALEENYMNDEVLVCRHSDFPEIKVPEGYLFILGDNRCNSLDSRYFGFVPDSSVIGKVAGGI